MAKSPFELNEQQIEVLRRAELQRQASRSQSKLTAPAALEANRTGQITAQQRSELISRSSQFGLLGVVILLILLGAEAVVAGHWLASNPIAGIIALIATLICTSVVVGRLYSIPMRHRLSDPHVEQLEGEVVWHGSGYVAEAHGRLLQGVFNEGTPLPPSLYTFFCLEGTHWLLSAELTGTHSAVVNAPEKSSNEAVFFPNVTPTGANAVKPPSNVDGIELSRALAETINFTAVDLDANRGGRLSGRQADALVRDILSNLWGVVLLLILVGLVVWAALGKAKVDISGLLVFLIFPGLGLLFLLVPSYRDFLDILGGQVLVLEGTVSRHTRSQRRGRPSYYYQVADRRFGVTYSAYQALLEGLRYRVYYVPRTGKLVSIEPLG